MTRTARAAFPRALVKDRSESKSGHRDDKHVRKDGAGAHGWGSLADEKELEEAALNDELLDFYGDDSSKPSEVIEIGKNSALESSASSSSTSGEELESAKEFRKNALKGKGIDLAAIARTSVAVSTSPTSPSSMKSVPPSAGPDIVAV